MSDHQRLNDVTLANNVKAWGFFDLQDSSEKRTLGVMHEVADRLLKCCDAVERLTAERDEARAAIERVRALHSDDPKDAGWCKECDYSWPCSAIRALATPEGRE